MKSYQKKMKITQKNIQEIKNNKMKRIIIFFILLFLLEAFNIKEKDLKYVMPSGKSFIFSNEKYPHYKVYDKKKNLLGICYLTTDVDNSIKGYVGPIVILVGLSKDGKITGIKILSHNENIKEAEKIKEKWFQNQFKNKSLNDKFEIGKDIQGITGATITASAVAKSVRITSQKIFEEFFNKIKTEIKNENISNESIILNPKWGTEKVKLDKIKEQIKSGNLSSKEAYHYKKE